MTRAIAVLTLSVLTAVLVAPVVAAAQTAPTPAPPASTPASSAPTNLAEVAKAEEARRKSVRKTAKVYTNNDLKPDNTTVRPAPATPAATPGAAVVNLPGGDEPAAAAPEARGEAYWNGRINGARAALEQSRVLADALQSRINALTTDFVNRDDPAQRAVIETNRKTALAELDRVRKDVESQQKEIVAIEDEARRANVPSGWLRPGA